MRRPAIFLNILIGFLLVLAPTAAAKNCTRGKPCGNTCINVNYTCHVTVPARTTPPAPAAALQRGLLRMQPSLELQGPYMVGEVRADGTFDLDVDGAREVVRLAGLRLPTVTDGHPSGAGAGSFLNRLLAGKAVFLQLPSRQHDEAGRLLAYVYLPAARGEWVNGTRTYLQANHELARWGWADLEPDPSGLGYGETYEAAIAQARAGGLGMWASAAAVPDDPRGPDRDCGSFATHAQAQAFFEAAGAGDPHRLDSDGDGIACESLP